MKPLAPELVGPISVCNTSVEVKGNIAGAMIEILVSGQTVSSHVSTKPDDVYPIGVTLVAGQVVTARQISGGQPSPESLPVTAQAAPSQLSALTVKSMLHSCGRALRVTGAVPGAKIDVLLGTEQIGAANAVKGWAGVQYDAGNSTQSPTIKQITCNNLTASQSAPAPVAFPSPLSAPVIQTPLLECQSRITIGGVADGAYVELYRNDETEPEDRFVFSVSTEFRWIKPLVKNDVIKVRQGYSCKKPAPPLETASPYVSATVQAVSALHAPKFLSVPCPGSTIVRLGHLVPGARVVLSQNGVELGETDASDVACNFLVPALSAGATLEAHMEMCAGKGPSATVNVGTQSLAPAIVVSPPYACASLIEVAVSGATGSYLAYVTNKNGQQISPYDNVTAPGTLVPVFPSLIAGDEITVHVQACGGAWQSHGPLTVLSNPPQPIIQQPLWAGYNTCTVTAVAGFVVYVYVNNVVRGSAITEGLLKTTVPLSVTLQVGEEVSCALIMCGALQKQTPPIEVAQQPPERPVLIDPPNGAGPVLLQPLLKWQDPGAGTPGAATSYQLQLTTGNTPILNTPVSTTSLTPSTPLAYDTVYSWTVTSINSGGQASAASPFSFTTEKSPAANLKFNGPITVPEPFPRGQWFTASVEVINQGNATSGPYEIVFTEYKTDDKTSLAMPTQDQEPPLAASGSLTQSAQFFIDSSVSQTVTIEADLMVNAQKVDDVWRVG